MKRRKNPAIDISDKALADLVRAAELMRPAVEVFARAIEREAEKQRLEAQYNGRKNGKA